MRGTGQLGGGVALERGDDIPDVALGDAHETLEHPANGRRIVKRVAKHAGAIVSRGVV